MKFLQQFVTALFAILILFSCNKYLDKKSNPSLIIPQTLDDLQGLMNDANIMNMQTPSLGESSADDYFLSPDVYNNLYPIERDVYLWQVKDYKIANDWSKGYQAIYNTNLCLELIEKVQPTLQNQVQWNRIKGSALFYRAYWYLNLSWIFSHAFDSASSANDLGIVLRLGSDFNIPSKRTNVKEAYARIIKDATEAGKYLPELSQHVIQPSKAAAYALLARAYLSMGVFDSSLKYSNLSLKIKNALMDYNNDPEIKGTNERVPFQKFNKEILFYSAMNVSFSNHSPYDALIDSTLFSTYHENDLRKITFFQPKGNYYAFKGSYAADLYILFTGLTTAEMYLTRAESYARKNMIAEAMADLNALAIKRWKNTLPFLEYSASNIDEAVQKVILERRKELVMRGVRWADIKRLNKLGLKITPTRFVEGKSYSIKPNESRYALPLPSDIIEITGMQQN